MAAGWLVYDLTGSAAWVGSLALAQRPPMVPLVVHWRHRSPTASSVAGSCSAARSARRCARAALALVVARDAGGALAVLAARRPQAAIGFGLQGPALLSLMPTLVPPEAAPVGRAADLGRHQPRAHHRPGRRRPAARGRRTRPRCFAVNAASFAAVDPECRAACRRRGPSPARGQARAPCAPLRLCSFRSRPFAVCCVGMAVFTCSPRPCRPCAPAIAAHVDGDPGRARRDADRVRGGGARRRLGARPGRAPLRARAADRRRASVGFAAALACVALRGVPAAAAGGDRARGRVLALDVRLYRRPPCSWGCATTCAGA